MDVDLGCAATTTDASNPLILPFSLLAFSADDDEDDDDDDNPDVQGTDAPASSSFEMLPASPPSSAHCAPSATSFAIFP